MALVAAAPGDGLGPKLAAGERVAHELRETLLRAAVPACNTVVEPVEA